eukprot:TRINITY_DN3095_c0_g1_i2.p1 TRINITY_DN3095_c0_g1~~TRINITY_DN3095_c0_g1_i2.p1  ORF type:complete len:247 (+),score=56.70 TRINITY_DN3095_c0_g1_i2:515-1255(+)
MVPSTPTSGPVSATVPTVVSPAAPPLSSGISAHVAAALSVACIDSAPLKIEHTVDAIISPPAVVVPVLPDGNADTVDTAVDEHLQRATPDTPELPVSLITKQRLDRAVTALCGHSQARVFMAPVPKSVAPNYDDLIRKRMDLNTIKHRVRGGRASLHAVYRDALHIAQNAMMFNEMDSEVWQAARDFKDHVFEVFAPLLAEFAPAEINPEAVKRSGLRERDASPGQARKRHRTRPNDMSDGEEGKT